MRGADEMEVKHGNNIFYVGDNQKELLAAMTFVPSGNDKIIIDHTEVSDELRGQNVGDKLLESLVEYSRENKLKIIPLCPFAKARIEKYPEKYSDILYKG